MGIEMVQTISPNSGLQKPNLPWLKPERLMKLRNPKADLASGTADTWAVSPPSPSFPWLVALFHTALPDGYWQLQLRVLTAHQPTG